MSAFRHFTVTLETGLEAHHHNLPSLLTPFIGREREIHTVCELLLRPEVRLVNLTGPGGIGKTRLALQAAAKLVEHFTDGVFWVALAPIRDLNLVAAIIAQALEVKETGGQPLVDSLAAALRSKHMLLLLDNFEQVLGAAPLISTLVTSAPRLTILVTSRAVLRLSGEREYRVPPLEVPDLLQLPSMERLTHYEAVRLFIDRAVAVRADFAVTTANAPALAAICQRLDGLPLALELAAARIRHMTPQALLGRLDSRLGLLIGGPTDLPPRQQTLRATIAWSYELLGPFEQALFTRLGVFVGGCTLEAAETICADAMLPTKTIFDGLGALVDNSLIQHSETPDGAGRYRMLATIREFALEQLARDPETAVATQARLQRWLVEQAEQTEPQLRSAAQAAWLMRLEQEHDNLRAVLDASYAVGDAITGVRLAGALWRFWFLQGYFGESHRWLEAGLAQAGGAPAGTAGQGAVWRGGASPLPGRVSASGGALRGGTSTGAPGGRCLAGSGYERHSGYCGI